ncbi:MAG TPA: FAD binding domain-containing protein [Solirubrobacteraceae bacterium]|nr:FAD binding domain-containing protein [Solirubrobacteraceae bacterium]
MVTHYLLPSSADEAAEHLAGGAALMAGGTTVMPRVLAGALPQTRVVGLARAGLDQVVTDGGRTTLGACTTVAAVAAHDRTPALAAAARAIGGPALRNMATVGGNLVVGAPYGDLGVVFLALAADVDLGDRTVSIERFWDEFRPGVDIVRAVAFNDDPAAVFVRWARRAANSPAVVCVAVAGGRVAVGGVGDHPVRSAGAEAHLDDPGAAGKAAAAEVDPPTDGIASSWYRKRMTEVFVRRAVEESHAV